MKWRRTVIANTICEDDWVVKRPAGQSVARIYTHWDGRWFWFAYPDQHHCGHGLVDTGREAREAAETVLRSAGIKVER